MIPGISIATIIQYYTSNPDFESELDQALRTFFNVASINDIPVPIEPMEEGLMNEWLVFDYHLSDGNTPLQHFIEHNPLQLTQSELKLYRELAKTQVYGIYEIQQIELGQALVMRDIYTNIIYRVHEQQATYQAEVGVLYPTRLTCVSGTWYIIGADSVVIPLHLSTSTRQYFLESKLKQTITPKDVYTWIQSYHNTSPRPKLERAEVEQRFAELLKEYGLNQMVSIPMIQTWLYEEPTELNGTWVITLLCNLIDRNRFSLDDSTPLMQGLVDLCNVSPRHRLQDVSPEQKMQQNQSEPHFTSYATDMFGKWMEYHERGLEFLQTGQYRKSVQEFKRAFTWLFKHRASDREIYRLFANAGVAHLANGDNAIGLALLRVAVELNPNYTFAKRQLKQHKHLQSGQAVSSAKILARHPAKRYKAWLDYLGIDFAIIP